MNAQDAIVRAAQEAGLDPNWALAVAERESGFNPNARSSRTIHGLFQMTKTLRDKYGIGDSTDPYTQARGWAAFVHDLRGEMRNGMGRDPTNAELYAGHHFGGGRAAGMIARMDPNMGVENVFTPNELAQNPHIARAGTVGNLVNSVGRDITRRSIRYGGGYRDEDMSRFVTGGDPVDMDANFVTGGDPVEEQQTAALADRPAAETALEQKLDRSDQLGDFDMPGRNQGMSPDTGSASPERNKYKERREPSKPGPQPPAPVQQMAAAMPNAALNKVGPGAFPEGRQFPQLYEGEQPITDPMHPTNRFEGIEDDPKRKWDDFIGTWSDPARKPRDASLRQMQTAALSAPSRDDDAVQRGSDRVLGDADIGTPNTEWVLPTPENRDKADRIFEQWRDQFRRGPENDKLFNEGKPPPDTPEPGSQFNVPLPPFATV